VPESIAPGFFVFISNPDPGSKIFDKLDPDPGSLFKFASSRCNSDVILLFRVVPREHWSVVQSRR